jgi:transcriptional regulator with XRE-family HTH domain
MQTLTDPGAAISLLHFVKELSGRRIERARRINGVTQAQLARDVGISPRWLREVEAGNPASKLDDHLRCAHQLGLSTGYMFLPLLFLGHGLEFPRALALGDLREIERQCIDLIAARGIDQVKAQLVQLTPRWWVDAVPESSAA